MGRRNRSRSRGRRSSRSSEDSSRDRRRRSRYTRRVSRERSPRSHCSRDRLSRSRTRIRSRDCVKQSRKQRDSHSRWRDYSDEFSPAPGRRDDHAGRSERRSPRDVCTPPPVLPPSWNDRESWITMLSRLEALERHSREPTTTAQGTEQIVEAIQSLKSVSTNSYYVSNFDPSIHDVDSWFAEVDRARLANKWDNRETLSRIGHCLKGDAKSWLNDWVSNDRTWTNFKLDFKTLCVKKIDSAGILFEVMSTNSDKYQTYAEYARKSLLRLRIVQGLSDQLVTDIVLRGVTDPQVKAAATNANLKSADLVNYLSTFVKSSKGLAANTGVDRRVGHDKTGGGYRSRGFKKSVHTKGVGRCYRCGDSGHKLTMCPKRSKPGTSSMLAPPEKETSLGLAVCAYCQKPGHDIKTCFAKQRTDQQRSKKTVNFCSAPLRKRNDIVVGIIQGVPIDILIDSGAIGVSLISSSVVNHFSCARKPTNCQIKGVGDAMVHINSYVTVTIELEGISLQADLLIVPSECMNAPVIIGTDVLNRDGITYIRTKDTQRIVRDKNSSIVSNVELNAQTVINTSLINDNLRKLKLILNEYSDHMISGTATSTVTTGCMRIQLDSNAPINYRPYKMSYDEKLRVRDIIKDLISKGIIRESVSPYSSPVLLVKKKDGSDRMCVDFRALNKVTVKDRYPLPLIDDLIDRLGKCKYFTSLDMATGFHQIRLHDESVPLTGFVTTEGHYEYLKMPYGLANAPIVYQRIISTTLRDFITSGKVLVYIDDCLTLSDTIDEGLQILKEVLATLTGAGFSINLKKCSFLCTEIEYLGRVISNGEVRPAPSKVTALVNSSPPRNVKQVRQFLGLAGYFRRYISDYSIKTACIARLTRKDVQFSWGSEQESARQKIISTLTNAPVLAIFDPNLPVEVHTDASSLGYGAILLQIHEGSIKRVVAYYSQVTKGAESKYHSYELETLAVVKALRHFRHYLVGKHFTVVTDCNALKATQNKKDLLPRVARWWVYMQDFNFTISYRKGTMLPHVDYLSRNPVNNITRPRNWAQIAQAGDEETKNMIQALERGELDSSRYVIKNDVLYYRYSHVGEDLRLLCYIPKGQRLSLLRIFHDEHSHIGVDKTLDLILRHFWFPGLRAFVKKYIGHCITCIAHKRVPRAPLQPISSWPKPDVPFHTLHLDALGPLPASNGYKHIMLAVDAFTKYCLLMPIRCQDLDELKRVCQTVISLFGTPQLMVSDRGRMFESTGFRSWMQALGVELHYITPEMHRSNGQVERYIRTVLNMLRIEVNYKKNQWADELWQLQLILNVTKQKTTQTSALNLLVGHENATPAIRALVRDVAQDSPAASREARREITRQRTAERLTSNQEAMDARVNRDRRSPRVFQEGDLVFVIKYAQSTGKLDHGVRGPYRVVRTLPHGRYELRLVAGSYGKTTYAAAQYMVPWGGEWTPEACSAFFEGVCCVTRRFMFIAFIHWDVAS